MKVKQCDLKYIGTNFSHYPMDGKPEIAFAGKSNVGKSSVINRLLQRKSMAKVGDKPGKTVHVNYFLLDRKGTGKNQLSARKNTHHQFLWCE